MANINYGIILNGELFLQNFDDSDTIRKNKLLNAGYLPVEVVTTLDSATQKFTGIITIDVQVEKIVKTHGIFNFYGYDITFCGLYNLPI